MNGKYRRKDTVKKISDKGYSVHTKVISGTPPRMLPRESNATKLFADMTDYRTWKPGHSETEDNRPLSEKVTRVKDEKLKIKGREIDCIVIQKDRTLKGSEVKIKFKEWHSKSTDIPIRGIIRLEQTTKMNMMGRIRNNEKHGTTKNTKVTKRV